MFINVTFHMQNEQHPRITNYTPVTPEQVSFGGKESDLCDDVNKSCMTQHGGTPWPGHVL